MSGKRHGSAKLLAEIEANKKKQERLEAELRDARRREREEERRRRSEFCGYLGEAVVDALGVEWKEIDVKALHDYLKAQRKGAIEASLFSVNDEAPTARQAALAARGWRRAVKESTKMPEIASEDASDPHDEDVASTYQAPVDSPLPYL